MMPWLKVPRLVAAIVVVFACALAASAAEPAAPAPPWNAFELRSVALDEHVTLHYMPAFEPRIDLFRSAYRDSAAASAKRQAEAEQLLAAEEAVLADLNRLVGLEPTPEQRATQSRLLREMLHMPMSPAQRGVPVHLYLLSQDEVKRRLQAGASFPGFTYVPREDRVEFKFDFASSSRNPDQPMHLPLPLDPSKVEEEVVESVMGMLHQAVPGQRGLALHELAELAIVWRMGPYSPYGRWFGDGFANALALHLLRQHLGEQAAAEMAQGIFDSEHPELRDRLNLAYWMGGVFEIQAPTEDERRIRSARYAAATREAQGLVERHGWDVLDKILDEAAEIEPARPDRVEAAVHAATGEDMSQRLRQYQSFETREDALRQYQSQMEAGIAADDHAAALSALIRAYEVQGGGDLRLYRRAAFLLHRLGHAEASEGVYLRAIELFESQPRLADELRKALLEHAVERDRPRAAYAAAEELLKREPDLLPALLVRMHRQAAAGEIAQAKETAQRILELAPPDAEGLRRLAQQVSQMPERPPAPGQGAPRGQ